MNEKITDDPILAGNHAGRILDDPMVQEALEAIQSAVVQAWRDTPVADVEAQHKLRCVLQGAEMFERYFREYIATGKIAQAQNGSLN